MDNSLDLLRIFSEVGGPSGYESRVREIVVTKFESIAETLETDQMGSVIANLGGPEGSPKVMISAHMDEVGLMVKSITEEGYIKFQQLGGWLDQAIVNQRWVILNDKKDVLGVTGIKTVHVIKSFFVSIIYIVMIILYCFTFFICECYFHIFTY